MARRPRKRKPPNRNYEHTILRGPGFWTLPDLISCEGVERGKWTNVLVVRASTYENRHLAIPLLAQAVASLVAASPTVARLENPTPVRPLAIPDVGITLETPQLDRFVCFRGIKVEGRLLEFLTERDDQHILVPVSSAAYTQLINHLKRASAEQ